MAQMVFNLFDYARFCDHYEHGYLTKSIKCFVWYAYYNMCHIMRNSNVSSHNNFVLNFTDISDNMCNVHVSTFDYEPLAFMVLVMFLFTSTSIGRQLGIVIVNIRLNVHGGNTLYVHFILLINFMSLYPSWGGVYRSWTGLDRRSNLSKQMDRTDRAEPGLHRTSTEKSGGKI